MAFGQMADAGTSEGRVLFFPLLFRLILKLEQIEWQEFLEDRALSTFSVRNTQRLFRADAVVNWFDDWIELESAGARVNRDAFGRVTAVESLELSADPAAIMAAAPMRRMIEQAQRLVQELGDKCAVAGYLTGPSTLAARARGESSALAMPALAGGHNDWSAASAVTSALARELCEAGCKTLLVVEHEAVTPEAIEQCGAIINIAQYYDRTMTLLCRYPLSAELADTALRAGFVAVASPDVTRNITTINTAKLERDEFEPIPAEAGTIMTDWEVTLETLPETLIRMREEVA
jgi:hypothetical protein